MRVRAVWEGRRAILGQQGVVDIAEELIRGRGFFFIDMGYRRP